MDGNFVSAILQLVATEPQQELLVWPGAAAADRPTTYSGHDLAQRIAACRQALAHQRVLPGQRVLLLVPVGVELICALLAVMAHGAVAVLPPPGVTPRAVLRLLRRGQLSALISLQPAPRLLRWVARACNVTYLTVSGLPRTGHLLAPARAVPLAQAALFSHSSGSTGAPKEVLRSQGVLLAQHEVLKRIFPPWAGQRDFPLFPNVLLHNLSAGIVSVLPQVPWADIPQFDPELVVRQLAHEQVQTLTGNVFYFQRLLPALRTWPGSFPAVVGVGVGGSPVPEGLLQALQLVFANAAVYAIYGSSEAEPIAVRRLTAAPFDLRRGYCAGPVQASLECQLLPCGELHLPDGQRAEVGEICVRGPHVAAADWLHTGDFGYFDEASCLWLTGRQGNEAVHQGVQHYQVEHVAQHVPGVARVGARATGAGFAVYFEGSATENAIKEVLADNFPPGLITAIRSRPHLPVDQRHHSKIRYSQLR